MKYDNRGHDVERELAIYRSDAEYFCNEFLESPIARQIMHIDKNDESKKISLMSDKAVVDRMIRSLNGNYDNIPKIKRRYIGKRRGCHFK